MMIKKSQFAAFNMIKAMLSQNKTRQIVLWNEANGDLIAMKTRLNSSKKAK